MASASKRSRGPLVSVAAEREAAMADPSSARAAAGTNARRASFMPSPSVASDDTHVLRLATGLLLCASIVALTAIGSLVVLILH